MEIFKLIIAGGRDFNDYKLLKKSCDYYLRDKVKTHKIIILSGKANGADLLGEKYAKDNEYKIEPYSANWKDLDAEICYVKVNHRGEKYNALAGFNRNQQMANNGDALIAFWDQKSEGTADMIKRAKNNELLVKVINY